VTSIQQYGKAALSTREAKRQSRAVEIRQTLIASAISDIDDQALVDVHRVIRNTQIGQAKVSGLVDLASHAAGVWTGFTMKMDLQTQMCASALPGLSVIMQRTLIEIDEALDDCTHKITGRGQLS